MKKLLILTSALLSGAVTFAQSVGNAGMESWRTGTAGSAPAVSIASPTLWWGFDSLAISAGQTFSMGIDKQQVFHETSFVHSGSSAAKLVSVEQGTMGILPGLLANAQPSLDLAVIIGGGDPMSAIIFDGGTATTMRPTTVSAWVAYFAGKDATTGAFGGDDAAVISAQAIATVAGNDSVVGMGFVPIGPSATYTEVTTPLTYTTTDYPVHTLRIIFSSGGGSTSGTPLDSSMLYVDDVSMTAEPQSVSNVYNAKLVSVFPNPASGTLYLTAPAGKSYNCTLADVAGKVVATAPVKGRTVLNVSQQPSGIYIYTISDADGTVVQRGKVSISN